MHGFRNRQRTDSIVVHASLTSPDQKDHQGNPVGYKYLDRKHREDGAFECGYHWLILRDGAAVQCRHEDMIGNHCPGVNGISVSVCMIGGHNDKGKPESNFTKDQWVTLHQLMDALTRKYPEAEVVGHCDVAAEETSCPSFDVKDWWRKTQERKHLKENSDAEPTGQSEETNPGTPSVA